MAAVNWRRKIPPAAIDVGARYGHTMIEFDAKLSKDGEIFLLHDDNLERTSNGWGVAGELPWRDLLKVDAGSWYSGEFKGEPLPLLAEVADRCRQHGMMANIEIKPTTGTGTLTGKVIALAARELWGGMTAPLLSSFEIDALEAAQAAVPELPRGLLLDEWREDWRELTTRLGCVSIHLNHRLLDEARVKMLKDAGLHILVYTVNKPQRAAELLRWGVDSICTDAIDLIGPNFPSGLRYHSTATDDLYARRRHPTTSHRCYSAAPAAAHSLPPWAGCWSAAGFAGCCCCIRLIVQILLQHALLLLLALHLICMRCWLGMT